jgi:hypothetical protein
LLNRRNSGLDNNRLLRRAHRQLQVPQQIRRRRDNRAPRNPAHRCNNPAHQLLALQVNLHQALRGNRPLPACLPDNREPRRLALLRPQALPRRERV